MILPKFPLRTESGLMIVNVRFDMARRIIGNSPQRHRGKREESKNQSADATNQHCDIEVD